MTWEYCDCNWQVNSKFDDGGCTPCGCGQRQHWCRGYRDTIIHWEGKHWRLECAFEEAVKRLDKLTKG